MKLLISLIIACFTCLPGWCTTIAWDNKHLCSDSQATCGHHKTYVKKMVRSDERHASLAAAGNYMRITLIMDYFTSCTDPLSKMNLPPSEDDGDAVDLLVVFDDGTALYYGGDLKTFSPVSAPFTMGAGGDIALGALKSGKTAEEAIKIAEDNDVFSSGNIQTIVAPQTEPTKDDDATLQEMIDQLKALQKPKVAEPKK